MGVTHMGLTQPIIANTWVTSTQRMLVMANLQLTEHMAPHLLAILKTIHTPLMVIRMDQVVSLPRCQVRNRRQQHFQHHSRAKGAEGRAAALAGVGVAAVADA